MNSKIVVLAKAIWIILLFTLIGGGGSPADAGTVRGWCTTVGSGGAVECLGSPMAACKRQHEAYAPASTFLGIKDIGRWDMAGCRWSDGSWPLPASVGFECLTGTKTAYEQCLDEGEDYAGREARDPPGQCNAGNNTGTGNSTTPNPIEILSGAKVYKAEDFRTADGSLVLSRTYRNLRFGTAAYLRRMPSSMGRNWQFDFHHELHIAFDFQYAYAVELQSAGGGTYRFNRQSDGSMAPATGAAPMPQRDYYLEFVGTWPSDLATVPTSQTQWKLTDSEDRVWLFQSFYDANLNYGVAHPIQVTFRGGLQWTFQYGSYNQLTSITDSFGKAITFDWILVDPNTQFGMTGQLVRPAAISQANLPDGTKVRYVYEALNASLTPLPQPDRLIRVEYVNAANTVVDSITYHYENTSFPLNVTGVSDGASNRIWTVTYDAAGRATQSTRPGGVDSYSVAYTAASENMTRTVTNALGKQAVYRYSRNSWLAIMDPKLVSIDGAASTHCPASTRAFTYDSDKFISSTTDEEGRVTSYVRDSRGRPTQITDGVGTPNARVTSYAWHASFNIPTQIVQPGLTTDFTWNTAGQLTQVTQTDTTTTSVPYSTNGQTRTWAFGYTATGGYLASVDGPLSGTGDTVGYAYNSQGYLQSVTNELGQVTQFTAWNGRGQPTAMTDPNGIVSALTYDDLGRLRTVTADTAGTAAVTTIDYGTSGLVSKLTRPNGSYLQYTWDGARRLTKVEDNTGAAVEYDRNALGNVTARRIKNAGATVLLAQTATFDELGRLLTFVGAGNQTWTSAYDKTDNRVSVTDPRTNVYQWAFDALNRLYRETDEDAAQVNLTRNGKDEVTAYSDPRSLATAYVRNGFGDVIQRTSPDSGTTVYQVDALGKPTQITDGRGVVTNLSYDAAGRLSAKQYPAATAENVAYTWDATAGGNKGIGRLTQITDASGSVAWVYDALGRVIQETKVTGAASYTVGYGYDADGNVTQMTYPSGRIVTYARDTLGRISGVTTRKDGASAVETLASDVAWQPFGPLQSLSYGNGLSLWKTFTSDYLLDMLLVEHPATSTTLISRAHTRTDDVNLTNIWDNVDTGRNEAYWYTASNKLQNGDGPWGAFTWYYDGVGNRTYEILTQGSTTTTRQFGYPSDSNRLGAVTEGSTTLRTFTYDGAGNLTADDRAGTVYGYGHDARGRLAQVSVGGQAKAGYVYDGLERLALRTTQNMTPSGTTHYVYDLAGHPIAEASASGGTVREYVWLDDMPLAVVADVDTAAPQTWFVHADHLDRPIKMTDAARAVVWDAVYKPFGEVHAVTGPASVALRFPGQYFLIEAGLHYNWHRHYDPTTGRYTQPDPLGLVDGPSVFAYVGSSPLAEIDELGLQRGIRPPNPWRAAGQYSRFSSPENYQGPFSIYRNVTHPNSRFANIRTNACRANIEENLIDAGYIQSVGNSNAFQRGGNSYTFYRSTSTGEQSMHFNSIDFGIRLKIRLGN